MKNTQKHSKPSKKSVLLSFLAIILVLLVSWWAFVNFMPRPLGDKLEYLGKKDLGGGWFYSDYKSYSDYYYGTDMSMEKIKTYFPKAKYEGPSAGSAYSIGYRIDFVDFSLNDQEFSISYYNDADAVIESAGINKTTKKYIISVPSYDYDIAKKAL